MDTFSQLWWVFPASIVFSTVAIGSGVSGALFFSPFFMLVVGLTPVQAVGAGLLTEVFGMGNGLRSYVRAKLVDYATVRWLLLGSIPAVILGDSSLVKRPVEYWRTQHHARRGPLKSGCCHSSAKRCPPRISP